MFLYRICSRCSTNTEMWETSTSPLSGEQDDPGALPSSDTTTNVTPRYKMHFVKFYKFWQLLRLLRVDLVQTSPKILFSNNFITWSENLVNSF